MRFTKRELRLLLDHSHNISSEYRSIPGNAFAVCDCCGNSVKKIINFASTPRGEHQQTNTVNGAVCHKCWSRFDYRRDYPKEAT